MDDLKKLEKRIEGLENKLDKVHKLYEKTISYANSDPVVSLQQARKAAEAICKQVLAYELGSDVGNMMLDKLIESISAKKCVPKKMIIHLKTIQQFGNYGSHDQGEDDEELSSEFIQPCLVSLSLIVSWYFNEYLHIDKDYGSNKQKNIKQFALELKKRLIDSTQLERLSFGLSLSTDDERVIDTEHHYLKLTRIDYMEYEGNKVNSYRWLVIKNVSDYPTHCIYHMECGENKITFEQFNARAHKNNPSGTKLIIDNLVQLQPSFVQKIRINFDKPLLPNETYEIFYRISWYGEIQSFSEENLSHSISLTRYYHGISWLKYGLLEKYDIKSIIAEKTTKCFEQVNVPEVPCSFGVNEIEDLEPLHNKEYKGYYYIFEKPDGHAYRFKYRLKKEKEYIDSDEF